jgi:hypothetical protein
MLLQLLETKTRVVAGIDNVTKELVRVLLATTLKVVGKNPETTEDLGGSVESEIHAERPSYPSLEYTKGTVALSVGVGSGIAW